jgi:hypothetical protein
MATEEATTEGR